VPSLVCSLFVFSHLCQVPTNDASFTDTLPRPRCPPPGCWQTTEPLARLLGNQDRHQNGIFWMRASIQTDMFPFEQPGQNVDIRGVIRCGHPLLLFAVWASVTNMSALGTQTVRKQNSQATLPLPTLARVYLAWPT
jgi:hypothetical protein